MKSTSKFLFPLLSALLMLTNACAYSTEMNGQPSLTKSFSISTPGELEVQTSGGSINVSAHEENQVRVEMHVRKGGSPVDFGDKNIEEALEEYEIIIKKEGNKVIASAQKENGGWFNNNNNISISFKVFLPKDMSCDLHTSGGSISLSGVTGEQEVKTSGGSLNLKNIKGDMEAKTSGGSININKYAGVLDASTSGGSISLSDASGQIVLHTSGGSINLDDVKGSLEASTSGGGIRANMLTLKGQLRLRTSGGSINATVPAGLGLDLDLKGNKVNTRLSNFDGEVEKDRIIGSINGGGIPVVMSTSGGSVNLDYR